MNVFFLDSELGRAWFSKDRSPFQAVREVKANICQMGRKQTKAKPHLNQNKNKQKVEIRQIKKYCRDIKHATFWNWLTTVNFVYRVLVSLAHVLIRLTVFRSQIIQKYLPKRQETAPTWLSLSTQHKVHLKAAWAGILSSNAPYQSAVNQCCCHLPQSLCAPLGISLNISCGIRV